MRKSVMYLAALMPALLFVVNGYSQNAWCGTMRNVQRHIDANPQMAVQYDDMLNYLRAMNDEEKQRGTNETNEVIVIPVVFHIIHNGDAVGAGENISEAQILSQITALNKQFNAQDADLSKVPAAFQSFVADCQIEFCLAKFDPQGNPTTGIERLQYSNATWDNENDIDGTLKPATIWDKNRYLNIWSVRMGGDLASNGVLAYATFPFFGPANQDGVVSRFNVIGTTGTLMASYNLGKSVTHEVGHWLGLLHTWGTSAGCGDAGDYIDDTPDQDDANYGCPTFPLVSCVASGPDGDMFMNYMDYSLDACRNMYTLDQKARMISILNGTRSSIKTSASSTCYYNLDANVLKVIHPTDSICATSFKPIVTLRNEGVVAITSGKFYYQVDGNSIEIFNWNGNIPSQGQLDITLPEMISVPGAHTFYVTFTNTNGQTSDNYVPNDSRSVTFTITNGSAGVTLPFSEGFEGNFPQNNWNIVNPNADLTWELNNGFGAYGQSSSCVSMNNLGYGANPNKKKDGLTTDAYDFSNVTYPQLSFDLAYAPYSSTRLDSLNVYYSLNCGDTWIKLWNQKGTELATAPEQTLLFTPAPSQWKTVSLPLLNLAGQNKVSFKFENVTGWGNALYLDNINVQNNQALSINETVKANVSVFPNPASNMAGIRFEPNHPFKSFSIYNAVGELVFESAVNGNSSIFSTESFTSGLYVIQLKGEGVQQIQKLLITK